MKFRTYVVAVALVLPAVASAGCGVSVETVGHEAASTSLPTASTSSRTRSVSAQFASAVSGTAALQRGRFEVSTNASAGGPGINVTVTGAYDTSARTLSFQVGDSGATSMFSGLRAVKAGDTLFLDLGEIVRAFGVKTQWVSIPVPEGGVPGVGTIDPGAFLDALRGVSNDVTTVGQEQVRGVSTTHLRASLVPSKALLKLAGDRRKDVERALGSSALDRPIPVDVWIGRDNRVRRFQFTARVGDTSSVATTYELYDLGQDVGIKAPPASEVTPVRNLPLLGHH